MKIILLIITSVLLLLSCGSNPTDSCGSYSVTLSGNWLWIRTSGGFAGQVFTPDSGTRVIDTYTPDGRYFKYRNDTLIDSKNYFVRKQFSIHSKDSLDALYFEDIPLDTTVLTTYSFLIARLTIDSLYLVMDMNDGYNSVFVRAY